LEGGEKKSSFLLVRDSEHDEVFGSDLVNVRHVSYRERRAGSVRFSSRVQRSVEEAMFRGRLLHHIGSILEKKKKKKKKTLVNQRTFCTTQIRGLQTDPLGHSVANWPLKDNVVCPRLCANSTWNSPPAGSFTMSPGSGGSSSHYDESQQAIKGGGVQTPYKLSMIEPPVLFRQVIDWVDSLRAHPVSPDKNKGVLTHRIIVVILRRRKSMRSLEGERLGGGMLEEELAA
jgi:hypothetical protein